MKRRRNSRFHEPITESEELNMVDLKCPYCGFTISVFIPEDATKQELEIIKACPCGRSMETEQEAETRMKKRGIKKKVFYAMTGGVKGKGKRWVVALRREGIEFQSQGITLYAYQKEINGSNVPICYIIEPETGLALQTVDCTLDVVTRHISRNIIKELKKHREDGGSIFYKARKKEFRNAKRVETLEGLNQ